MSFETFSAAPIRRIRRTIARWFEGRRAVPQGWSRSDVDPMEIVARFPALRVRSGFVFRGYRFVRYDDGNGVVWAMPVGADFPEPEACERLDGSPLATPRPLHALPSRMSHVEGDNTPWSYLCASILDRELGEFAAMWHGIDWGAHDVIDGWPSPRGPEPVAPPDAPEWTWLVPKPTSYRPSVETEGERVTVRFYTFTRLVTEAVIRHTDRYRAGDYEPETVVRTVATGSRGYIP